MLAPRCEFFLDEKNLVRRNIKVLEIIVISVGQVALILRGRLYDIAVLVQINSPTIYLLAFIVSLYEEQLAFAEKQFRHLARNRYREEVAVVAVNLQDIHIAVIVIAPLVVGDYRVSIYCEKPCFQNYEVVLVKI